MSARRQKADPVIGAWDRLQAAEKADRGAWDALEEAEVRAQAKGFDRPRPMVRIAGDDCITMHDARRSAKRLPKEQARERLEAMRRALAAWEQRRRAAGLRAYELAAARTRREWRAAMQGIADTRATTLAGVILKLKLIALELRDGKTNYGESILASAISDLGRIGRKL
jgi:hypothetical protein